MLKLAKTMGGQDGSPTICNCTSVHFIKVGFAWQCSDCGSYFPPTMDYQRKELDKSLKKWEELRSEFRAAIKELEDLVKE